MENKSTEGCQIPRISTWFRETSELQICGRHEEYSGFLYSSLYLHLGHCPNIAVLVQKRKGFPCSAMGICFQHPWLQNYLTRSVSSLDILYLQPLQYRSVLGIEKESAERGCSVKTITSKGLGSKLTFLRVGENSECIPATSSSSDPDRHTKRFTDAHVHRAYLTAEQRHLVPALTFAVNQLF